MKLILSPEFINKYPSSIISFGIVRGIKVFGPNDNSNKILLDVYPLIKEKYNLENLQRISNSLAYINLSKKINISPDSAFLPHLQIKRVLKEKPIGNINNVVNEYMALELLYDLSFAAYDLDTIIGDVKIDVARGGEEIICIGEEKTVAVPNDLIISDDNGLFYSFSQGYRDTSKITTQTSNVLFQIDAPEGVNKAEVEKGIQELCHKFNSSDYVVLDRINNISIL